MLSQPGQAATGQPGVVCVLFLCCCIRPKGQTPLLLSDAWVGVAPFHLSQCFKGGCCGKKAIQTEPVYVQEGCRGPCPPWSDRDRADERCLGRKRPTHFCLIVQILCQENQVSCARMPVCSSFICFLSWGVRKPTLGLALVSRCPWSAHLFKGRTEPS